MDLGPRAVGLKHGGEREGGRGGSNCHLYAKK